MTDLITRLGNPIGFEEVDSGLGGKVTKSGDGIENRNLSSSGEPHRI